MTTKRTGSELVKRPLAVHPTGAEYMIFKMADAKEERSLFGDRGLG